MYEEKKVIVKDPTCNSVAILLLRTFVSYIMFLKIFSFFWDLFKPLLYQAFLFIPLFTILYSEKFTFYLRKKKEKRKTIPVI